MEGNRQTKMEDTDGVLQSLPVYETGGILLHETTSMLHGHVWCTTISACVRACMWNGCFPKCCV